MSLRIAVYQHFLQFFRVDSDMDAHFSQRKNMVLPTKPTFSVYKKDSSCWSIFIRKRKKAEILIMAKDFDFLILLRFLCFLKGKLLKKNLFYITKQ